VELGDITATREGTTLAVAALMQVGALDVVREEKTHPAIEHDAMVARQFAASHAAVLLTDAGTDHALVVLRHGLGAVGALHGDHRWTDLDGLPIDAVTAALLAGSDDAIAARAIEIVRAAYVEHDIIRDTRGVCVAVVIVGSAAPFGAPRAIRALARASRSLVGWASASGDAEVAALALIEHIDRAVIVHDHELVLAANRAAAHLLRCPRADALVGLPLSTLFPRLPRLPFFAAELGMVRRDQSVVRVCTREHSLVLAGRTLRALLVEESAAPPSPPTIELAPIVDSVVASVNASLRRAGRVRVLRGRNPLVVADAAALREVISLALLDAASSLDERDATHNCIEIGFLERDDGDAVLQITARGTLIPARTSHEPVGSAVCGVRVGRLGGDLEIEPATSDRRVVRVVLPRSYR